MSSSAPLPGRIFGFLVGMGVRVGDDDVGVGSESHSPVSAGGDREALEFVKVWADCGAELSLGFGKEREVDCIGRKIGRVDAGGLVIASLSLGGCVTVMHFLGVDLTSVLISNNLKLFQLVHNEI